LEFVTVDGRDLILIRELRRYLAHRKEEPTQMVLFESEESESKDRKSRKT